MLNAIFLATVINYDLIISKEISDIANNWQKITPLSVCIILAVVINGILPTFIKDTLVFLRLKNPLPGCRAFSNIAKQDSRVDLSVIKASWGGLPKKPEKQNKLWYKIYSQHKNDTAVRQSHKDFLFTRDYTAISFLFLILGSSLSFLLLGTGGLFWCYSILMLLQYVLVSLAARNYGIRMVTNVLAIESAR